MFWLFKGQYVSAGAVDLRLCGGIYLEGRTYARTSPAYSRDKINSTEWSAIERRLFSRLKHAAGLCKVVVISQLEERFVGSGRSRPTYFVVGKLVCARVGRDGIAIKTRNLNLIQQFTSIEMIV